MNGKRYTVKVEKKAPAGAKVFVCGDFNDWSETRNPLTYSVADGVFQGVLELPKGIYRYKFLVDGIWCLDDANGEFVISGMDRFDNLLEVSGTARNRK